MECLDTDYTCLVCSQVLKNAEESKTHIKTHDVEELYFRSKNLFKKLIEYTIEISDSQQQFKCQLCQLVVKTGKTTIMLHYSKHMSNFDVFMDRNLNRKFKQISVVLEKIPDAPLDSMEPKTSRKYCVEGESCHACAMCNGSYATVKKLGYHISHVHNKHKKNKICELCGLTLASNQNLMLHMKVHYNVKEFNCSYCNKLFRTTRDLKRHVSTHTGEEPYKCEHCDKGFTSNSSLSRHIQIHTGERNHFCRICNRSFITRSNMNIHLVACQKRYYRQTEPQIILHE